MNARPSLCFGGRYVYGGKGWWAYASTIVQMIAGNASAIKYAIVGSFSDLLMNGD